MVKKLRKLKVIKEIVISDTIYYKIVNCYYTLYNKENVSFIINKLN